ncbi:hypothetical protein [Carnobacterium maltaromaticum]|uniref:hypothetical protein n=1 Tax=Carnobacterium maltaromaticum TaxID=2751 RepID=UPI0039AF8F1D
MKMHDNEIISYEINLKEQTINIKTQAPNEKEEYIFFTDVFAYYFENQLLGSVILDLFEEPLEKFVVDNESLLIEGRKNAWPMHYKEISQLEAKVKAGNLKYYIIASSYGLRGWVLAKNLILKNSLI